MRLTALAAGAAAAIILMDGTPAPAATPMVRVGPGILRPVYMPEPGVTETP